MKKLDHIIYELEQIAKRQDQIIDTLNSAMGLKIKEKLKHERNRNALRKEVNNKIHHYIDNFDDHFPAPSRSEKASDYNEKMIKESPRAKNKEKS